MGLHKTLGFFSLTMYGVGIIVGAGIYALIGEASGMAGYGVWLSFLLGAIIAAFTALSYAELSSAFTECSAEANYVGMASGKNWLGFLVGWLVVAVGFVAAAVVSLGFAGYFATIFPLPMLIIAIALIIILSMVDLIGIDVSAKINIAFTIVSLIGIIIVIALGIPYLGSADYFALDNGFNGVLGATALIFFAYLGFEAIVKLGEETRHAKKIMPKALLASIAISSVLYVLLALSAVSILSPEQLGATKAPLAEVAAAAGTPELGMLLTIIALFAMVTTVLVSLIVTSRLLYGLAEKHELPLIFLRTSKKTGAPYIAVFVTMIAAILMCFFSEIAIIAKATTFMVFVTFLAVNVSLIMLRRKKNYRPEFRVPLNIKNFPVIAFFGAISSAFMLTRYSYFEWAIAVVFVIIGIAVYKIEKTRIK